MNQGNGAQTEEKNCLKKRRRQVIETILVDTEDVWGKIFQEKIWNIKTKMGCFPSL
jgi:predicted metalloprotease